MAIEITEKDLDKTSKKKKKLGISEKIVDFVHKIPESIKDVSKIVENIKGLKEKQIGKQSVQNFNAHAKAEAITNKLFALVDKYQPYIKGQTSEEIIPVLRKNKNKIIDEIEAELK